MKLKHLKGNIYAVKGKTARLTFGTPGITANSLFIDDRQKAVIDPASNKEILTAIGKRHRVDYCFLSHVHLDHICSLSCFPNARILAHRKEKAALDNIAYCLLYSRHFLFCFLELWKNKLLKFKVHQRFTDGETYHIGDTQLQVIHAPGHTGGHSFFYFPKERILYSGDYDLSVMGPSYSYTDSNIEDMLLTTAKVKALPVDIWVSGHWRFVVTDDIDKKIDRFIRQIHDRDERILTALHMSKSKPEALLAGKNIILPSSIVKNSWLMQAMEKKMITMHLERLQQQGKVRKLINKRWVRAE